ncbi:MAG TPA: hypothetical protein VFQ33_11300, partial [Xanthobacteraceae bacterium]|nr:hypothetical protein [Xanthobacteraceae bacterium]
VGLIVTFFTLTTVAAKQATPGDVPLVVAVRRPGRDGLVASLAQPRGAPSGNFSAVVRATFPHAPGEPSPAFLVRAEVREHSPMTKSDQFRAKAEECRLMAAKVTTPIDQAAWLELATDWLGLIPEPAQTASDRFDATERDRGTRQLRSSAEH